MEAAIAWGFADLCMGASNGKVRLLLTNIRLHEPAESVDRIQVPVECLLISLGRVRVLFLNELQISHLNVAQLTLRGHLDRFASVSLDRKSTRLNSSHLGIS